MEHANMRAQMPTSLHEEEEYLMPLEQLLSPGAVSHALVEETDPK